MFITSDKLFKLPVEDESHELLGRVVELEIDIESQSIIRYRVAPTSIVARVFKGEYLLVHRDQVISISEERMVVESTSVLSEQAESKNNLKIVDLKSQPTPAVNQDIEMG